jgi:NTP pyrophosphatase (non-canonical NTP hydrolase)
MPAIITGDYSRYPDSIRKVFPYLVGETCELRQGWQVYERLFMEDRTRTELLSKHLGGVLGMFQTLLQDNIFLSIARLTDKESGRSQSNLSLWALEAALPAAKNPDFGVKVQDFLTAISKAADNVRKHRHKRLAHFDLKVSLKEAVLPVVTFKELWSLIEQVESLLNLFYGEFEDSTMLFDTMQGYEITGHTERAVYKAKTYDDFEKDNVIPKLEWKRRAET